MNSRLVQMVEHVFRGYGQLFLANRVGAGICFFLGLLILSPWNGLWSLLGALTVTGMAWWLACPTSLVRSGLFGVNGVLLGCTWMGFPEASEPVKGLVTVAGAVLMALMLVPGTVYCRNKALPLTLFTVPYVVVFWTGLVLLSGLGLHDRHFPAGWTALMVHSPAEAKQQFAAVQVVSARAAAYQQDGLGWANFHLQDYGQGREHFQKAVDLLPDLADAYDGLGWSFFRLKQFDQAAAAFRQGVGCDPMLADSWDGLGWIALRAGDADLAKHCFGRAVLAAPLFSDAYFGLSQSLSLSGGSPALPACRWLASVTKQYVAGRYQWVSLSQLVCWLFFLMGIALHSRVSILVALGGLAVCVTGGRLFPARCGCMLDVDFIFNLLAILLALGGNYMRMNRVTLIWMAVVTVALALCWKALSVHWAGSGLPLLCLPFNAVLVGTILLFSGLQRLGVREQLIPLEMAVTSPEKVRLWVRKREIARKCWRRIAAGPKPVA